MTAAFSSRRWVATAMLAALTLPALAQTQAPALLPQGRQRPRPQGR